MATFTTPSSSECTAKPRTVPRPPSTPLRAGRAAVQNRTVTPRFGFPSRSFTTPGSTVIR